jgi:long-chain acyl-CoA synthetase
MSEAAVPRGWPAMSITEAHALLGAPGSVVEAEEIVIRGIPTRVWKNLPPSLRSVVEHARSHGAKDFLVYGDERVSFEGFHRAVAAFAQELQAQGVGKGDRVAVIMRNVPEFVVAFYAAAVAGAIATPLNAWWTGPELEYGLVDSGAKVAVVDAERYQRIAEHLKNCPLLTRVYVSRELDEIAHPKIAKLETVLGGANAWAALPDAPLPAVELAPDDPATIFYTSGTTAEPKGVLASHRAVNSNIFTAQAAVARAYLRRGEAPPAPDPENRRHLLITVPLFHVTACIAMLNPSLFLGAKFVMMRKWEPERAFEIIERERITVVAGVPTIAWQLIEHPARGRYDLSSIEGVQYGGAPAAPDLVPRLKEAFPTCEPGQGWGMTETCATVTSNGYEDYVNRPDSCGPPALVAELQVRDPADGVTVLPAGEVGELWSKGPMNAIGYWNKPEPTAQTFVDGWVRTGDLARLDDEGFCYIIDRAKDMLIRGGENIYCVEVENALFAHPAVMDAAVVGVAHRTLGEEPVAAVTLKPGAQASEDELRAHVAERLAAFKVPVKVLFLSETLPRNVNGKVLKGELRKLFAAEPAAA